MMNLSAVCCYLQTWPTGEQLNYTSKHLLVNGPEGFTAALWCRKSELASLIYFRIADFAKKQHSVNVLTSKNIFYFWKSKNMSKVCLCLRVHPQRYPAEVTDLISEGEIGSGTCGQVFKVRFKKTGHVIAVKVRPSCTHPYTLLSVLPVLWKPAKT